MPTTSQYSSKVSPVSFVSDIGDFTNPAGEGKRVGVAGKEKKERKRKKIVKRPGWIGGEGNKIASEDGKDKIIITKSIRNNLSDH